MLVEGEAGIGKSRLIDEFTLAARVSGARVLAGGCLPFADAVPYAAFASILDDLIGPLPVAGRPRSPTRSAGSGSSAAVDRTRRRRGGRRSP